MDSGYTPPFATWGSGTVWTNNSTTVTGPAGGYQAALYKFGCFANGSSVMLPPAFGTFGNISRYGFRGEPFRQWDLSVSKDVRITERLNAQFRFETFNVLNQVNYSPTPATPP